MVRTLAPAAFLAAAFSLSALSAGAVGLAEEADRIGLSNEDYEMLSAAAESLYTAPGAAAGDAAEWTNPATGASGTVTVSGVEGNCVSMAHVLMSKTHPDPVEIATQRCLSADGRWLTAPAE